MVHIDEAVFSVLDTETNGLDPRRGRIIEVGLVRVEGGRIVDEWETLVNPHAGVGATHIHGIRSEDVVDAPVFSEVAGEILARIEGSILTAHNLPFDWGFLSEEVVRAGMRMPEVETLDTVKAARRWAPELGRYKLAYVCSELGVDLHGAHSALGDARATAEVLLILLERMRAEGVEEVPSPTHWEVPVLGLTKTKVRERVSVGF